MNGSQSGVLYPNEIRKSRYRGGYSWETQIDEHKKAPGFFSPPPNGTPGSTQNPGAAAGPSAHTVGGYTRRNPTSSGTEPAPKQGGDVVPAQRDGDERRGELIELAARLRAVDPRAAAIADQVMGLADAA